MIQLKYTFYAFASQEDYEKFNFFFKKECETHAELKKSISGSLF